MQYADGCLRHLVCLTINGIQGNLMKKSILAVALLSIGVAGSAHAASFLNGGFEDGTTSSWTQGGGYWSSGVLPATNNYFSGGANYNLAPSVVTVTNAGTDSITGLSTVRYGAHSVRVNDSNNNYSVSGIRQSVTNYDGNSINFSWAAVLESSHGATDSDQFRITLTDDTTNTVLANIAYNSFQNGALFSQFGNWFGTQWIDETIAVTQGHNFTLTLLASDCPYGGHAGYVYLDGFGTVTGGGGDNGTGGGSVPEPGSLALAALGLMAAAGIRRRKSV